MTRPLSILTAVALLSQFASAAGAQPTDPEQLQKSLEKWQVVKQECSGNYSYTVRWSSFTGFGHETEIVVRDNKVSERRYREFNNQPVPVPVPPGQPDPGPQGKTWTETVADLGTHPEGAAAKTLDELYAEAAEVVKRELADYERRYVRFDDQGLLRSCFTVDTRIADDAPQRGVTVAKISVEAPKPAKVYRSPSGKPYPAHWGEPPRIQTRDLRPLPDGYGQGSGTLLRWIQQNMARDAQSNE